MTDFILYKECQSCRGTGERQDSEESSVGLCSFCAGEGKIPLLTLDLGDIEDKVNDILDKVNDIFERVSA